MKLFSRMAWAGAGWQEHGRQTRVAARVRAREDKPQGGPPGSARGGVHPESGLCPAFEISCITGQFGAPELTGAWRRLLAASASPEKIYQTPEYFRFLADSHSSGADQFELYLVKDRVQDKTVGIVPVRVSTIPLGFTLGPVCLYAFAPRVIRLLGSVPLMPQDSALMHQLCAHLLQAFPGSAAVSMQAWPQELYGQLGDDQRHRALVVHGWRACHTIPLPPDMPAYLAKLNAKKRYKLARQYRLLEQAAGPLSLQRIDRSVNVKQLVAGVAALAGAGAPCLAAARDYRVLAANRLLLSYVLRSDDEVIAVVAGSRYGDTWHVHQVMYAPAYRRWSAGAVALHAALQDVITDFAFASADFGYGTPRARFASTHVLKTRAHVLVARRGSWAALVLGAFVRFDDARGACARRIKPWLRQLQGK